MNKRVRKSTSRLRSIKKFFIRPFYALSKEKYTFIILGCQRSGTTLLTNIIDRIIYTKVFGEFSPLSSQSKDKLRLNSIQSVKRKINSTKSPLIVMKPLVESQNALMLLNEIPNSTIIWLYRDFKDVILSNASKFKLTAGFKNIEPILESDFDNWRSEGASNSTIKLLRSLYTNNSTNDDAGALFWYARNILFFEQNLDTNPKAYLWKYEDFVKSPGDYISSIINDKALSKPNTNIFNIVSTDYIGAANNIKVNNNINELCKSLMKELDSKRTLPKS